MREKRNRSSSEPGPGSLNPYAMLQFFSWATISCFNPYVTVTLTDRGLNNSGIGLILTLNALVSIVAQPAWGLISDRIHSIRKVFIICLAGSSLAIMLIPRAQSFSQLIVLYPLVLFFLSPVAPLLDVWTYQGGSLRPGSSYGSLRLWGSLGFALYLIPLGRMVTLTGLNVTSYSFVFLAVVSVLISLTLPAVQQKQISPVMQPSTGSLKISALLGQKAYLSYLFVIFLAFISIQPMFGFQARLMLEVGGNQELYMWTMALAALSEIPVFIWSKRLISRFRPASLIIISFAVFIIRMVIYSAVTEPWHIILTSLIHGFSYALFLVATVSYIDNLAPQGMKSTALTIASAIYIGLSGMVGNTITGRLMDSIGIRPVYLLGALATTLALVLFILTLLPGSRLIRKA